MRTDDLRCPRCAAELVFETDDLACVGCKARLRIVDGVADLRSEPERAREPSPAADEPLRRALERLAAAEPFKAALEGLLLDLDDPAAERLMLLLREGRGAWHPLARAREGRVLLLANAFSGAAVPLASAGFRVTVVDPCAERARFGEFRNRALTSGTRTLVACRAKRTSSRTRSTSADACRAARSC
jgi:hypothetical protein